MFPLGDTPRPQARDEARDCGLLVADKPDSHDVCFIADGDTQGFLARQRGPAPGRSSMRTGPYSAPMTALTGSPWARARDCASTGPPRMASPGTCCPSSRSPAPSPSAHRCVGGPRDLRDPPGVDRLRATPSVPIECSMQLRAHGEVYPCVAAARGDDLHIELRESARAVAPG